MPYFVSFSVRQLLLRALLCSGALLAGSNAAPVDAADGLPWLKHPAVPASTTPKPVTAPASQPSDNSVPSLRLEVSGEEPSAIYYDTQTLKTQTPLIFAIKVTNSLATARRVALTWRVTDVNGKVVLQKNASYRVEGNGLLLRRELVSVSSYGAYVLSVEASAKRSGPNESISATWPFAIVGEPVSGYRPQSFFGLTTSAALSARQLDFYERIGARVLRSPWQSQADNSSSGLTVLDQQIRERLSRKLATVGVLGPNGEDSPGGTIDEWWTRSALPLMTRYAAIKTWEVSAPITSTQQISLAAAARAARPELKLLWPLRFDSRNTEPAHPLTTDTSAPDAVTVPWLQDADWRSAIQSSALPTAVIVANAQTHPAGILRALLAQQDLGRQAGANAVFIHQEATGPTADALSAASALVRGYALAIMSGAAGMSMNLNAPGADTPAGDAVPPQMARAAAFSAMTHLLEDASFERDLFPQSPTLWGTLFRTPAAAIATVWTARASEQGRLVAHIDQADLLDLFGNVVARARRGVLVVPLSAVPTYIVSHDAPENLARALHEAQVEGLRPLAAQILPLTQKLKFTVPTTATHSSLGAHSPASSVTPPATQALRVRLQNTLIHPLTGILRVTTPHGWAVARDTLTYALQPGESHLYQFDIVRAVALPGGNYPITVVASYGHSRWQWRQALRVATAMNVKRGHPIHLDGDLRDWSDAVWMQAQGATSTQRVRARVALRWNTQRLYIAAEVAEPSLRPRRAEDTTYPFWAGYDALQIAFGSHDTPASQPGRGPFYDTDYGFLLCPFNKSSDGHIEGRVLRLWSPSAAFSAPHDPVRYSGIVAGAICIVRRDPQTRLTRYEASVPLSAIPALRPHLRAAHDSTVRFGWILHNSAGADIQWNHATSVFPWWGNPGSFLPSPKLYLAALTPLGFTQDGLIDAPVEYHKPKPPVAKHPQPPVRRLHPHPRPHSTPRPTRSVPSRQLPPQLAPMSPRLLPPAAPQTGPQVPPSLTPSQGR